MKIMLAGDLHGSVHDLERTMRHAASNNVERVFYLGDFGYDYRYNFVQKATRLSHETGLMVDFIEGNHDSFDYLYSFPIAKDGYRTIALGVRHIPRGTIIDLDGKKVLAMGGASSLDRLYRQPGVSWWPEELITDRDMTVAGRNLLAAGGKVDAIFAHDGPVMPKSDDQAVLFQMHPELRHDLMLSLVQRSKLKALLAVAMPGHWYHGHHHVRWTTVYEAWYGSVMIECLGRDGQSLDKLTTIVHTEDWI